MTITTPYLTDLPGVATEYAEVATLEPERSRRVLRDLHAAGRRGVAWRYYYPPQPAEVADRVRRARQRSPQ